MPDQVFIIPANPGFQVVEASVDGKEVLSHSIIAWQIRTYGESAYEQLPICASILFHVSDCAFRLPDGRLLDRRGFETTEEKILEQYNKNVTAG